MMGAPQASRRKITDSRPYVSNVGARREKGDGDSRTKKPHCKHVETGKEQGGRRRKKYARSERVEHTNKQRGGRINYIEIGDGEYKGT